jgi:release factor glutamine methyltransferase
VATIGELLRGASAVLAESGSPSPRLDAEVLLGHVLRVDRATLLAAPEATVSAPQQQTFESLIERRASGEPVAYIRGLKEFYGLAFTVDRRALIPRPETERLVELALQRLGRMLTSAPRPAGTPSLTVWDAGTGSGAIAVALAAEARRRRWTAEVRIIASDTSADALALATENAVVHGVADAIEFHAADLTDVPDLPAVDLLLANLPYVPSADLPRLPVAASFEPAVALDGGPDGLDVIRRLIAELPATLAPRGVALLEIGSDQVDGVGQLVDALGSGWQSAVHDDLGGRPRVVEIWRVEA